MKHNLLGIMLITSIMLLLAVDLQAQPEIPEEVLTKFKEMFPGADFVNWENEDEEYFANFIFEDHDVTAFFKADGEWTQTNTSLEYEEIPMTAQLFIEKEFKGEGEYFLILKKETPSNLIFVVNFESSSKEVKLQFDETGVLLKKEIKDIE